MSTGQGPGPMSGSPGCLDSRGSGLLGSFVGLEGPQDHRPGGGCEHCLCTQKLRSALGVPFLQPFTSFSYNNNRPCPSFIGHKILSHSLTSSHWPCDEEPIYPLYRTRNGSSRGSFSDSSQITGQDVGSEPLSKSGSKQCGNGGLTSPGPCCSRNWHSDHTAPQPPPPANTGAGGCCSTREWERI